MIANWYYAGQIASKNSLIDLQKGRLDDFKEKLNGASPDEAKTRMKALQAEVDALKPRRLSPEQRQTLHTILSRQPSTMKILSDAACSDCQPYARALAGAFRESGWQARDAMLMGSTSYPSDGGLAVYVSDRASPLPAETLMIEALTAAGVSHKVYQFKSQDFFRPRRRRAHASERH